MFIGHSLSLAQDRSRDREWPKVPESSLDSCKRNQFDGEMNLRPNMDVQVAVLGTNEKINRNRPTGKKGGEVVYSGQQKNMQINFFFFILMFEYFVLAIELADCNSESLS